MERVQPRHHSTSVIGYCRGRDSICLEHSFGEIRLGRIREGPNDKKIVVHVSLGLSSNCLFGFFAFRDHTLSGVGGHWLVSLESLHEVPVSVRL